MRLFLRPVAFIVLLALTACGGGDLLLPNEGQPAKVDMVSGDRQTAAILEPAADSLVVRVTDRFGSPVSGAEIAWSADGGGEVSLSLIHILTLPTKLEV
jgi:predicted small lipoprotein YifL